MNKPKLVRVTTVPISMNILLKNQLKFMSRHFQVIGITSYHEKHFHEIEERENAKMYNIHLTRTISPITDIYSLLQLISIFLKERPDIVHSHTPKAGLLSMIAAKLTKVPIRLHTLAGMPLMEAKGIKKWLYLIAEKTTYVCATKIYPNSFGLFDYVIAKKLGQINKFKVLGNGSTNGIDLDFFSKRQFGNITKLKNKIRSDNNIGLRDIVFCFVGRLAKDKGINELVSSFTSLAEKYNKKLELKIHLLILGVYDHGDLPSQRTIKLIESNNSIKSLGRFDDIRPYLLASDALVFPSYREGFPNAVLQAGAMELPSVVTDISGCNEIITNGVNGLIVPVKNTEKLIEAMEYLIINKQLIIQMGRKARELIVENYDQTKLHNIILDEYKSLLTQRN